MWRERRELGVGICWRLRLDADAFSEAWWFMLGVGGYAHARTFPSWGSAEPAVPFVFWLFSQADAGIVKPLDGAIVVIARDHFIERDLVAVAVRGFCGVERHFGSVGTNDRGGTRGLRGGRDDGRGSGDDGSATTFLRGERLGFAFACSACD